MTKAAEYYRKAADLGHRDSQYFLADMYCKGEGIAKSLQKARALYKKAADQDCSDYQFQYAKMIIENEGGDGTYLEVITYMVKAANHEHRRIT